MTTCNMLSIQKSRSLKGHPPDWLRLKLLITRSQICPYPVILDFVHQLDMKINVCEMILNEIIIQDI